MLGYKVTNLQSTTFQEQTPAAPDQNHTAVAAFDFQIHLMFDVHLFALFDLLTLRNLDFRRRVSLLAARLRRLLSLFNVWQNP
jgi:hypothetical protein